MTWRGLLLDNLVFKVVALVVVSMLWLSVTADERQAQPVKTRLEVDVRDPDWVLIEAPGEINTVFQGRNRELLGLLMEEPTVRLAIDSVTGDLMRVPLFVDQVVYDRDLGVVPSLLQPASVTLRFARRDSIRVPVVPDVDAMPGGGFTVLMPIHVDPESVTVHGPVSRLDSLVRVTTRRLELDAVENTVVRDVPVALPADAGLSADPPTVVVTVEVDSLVVRRRTIPVRLVGPAAEFARAEPARVAIEVRGASSSVAALLETITELQLRVEEPPSGPARRELSTESTSEGPTAIRFDPPAVTLRPVP